MTDKLGKRLYKDSLGSRMKRTRQGITKAAKVQRINSADELTSSLGLLESGEFRVGNNTSPGSGFTGVRMLYPGAVYGGETYNLAGVNNDVLQWGGRVSDGVFEAGAGKVVLDANGISIEEGLATESRIKWISGASAIAYITGDYADPVSSLALNVNPDKFSDGGTFAVTVLSGTVGLASESIILTDDPVESIIWRWRWFDGATDFNFMQFDGTELAFNEAGEDVDTRIESENIADCFKVDAGDDTVEMKGLVYPKVAVTLSSDAFTWSSGVYISVSGQGAAADDLATINGTKEGQVVILTRGGSETITVKDGTGNINLNGSADRVLDSASDKVMLINRNGTALDEIPSES